MKKPTAEEIQKEAAALEEMMPRVRRFTAFGDDNHSFIKAQIQVLKRQMSEDEIYSRFDGDDATNAMEARAWIDGQADESPVESWKCLESR